MQFTSINDVSWWVQQVGVGTESGRDFQGPRFLRPVHFAVLAGSAHRRGRAINVPSQLEGYAARMRLWQAIGLTPPKRVTERDPEGRFHPLAPITSEADADELAGEVCGVFRASGTTDARALNAIDIVLNEIIGNCYFHATDVPGIRGLACAQSWPKGNLAQVAIADTGMGIRATLARNPANAARLAVPGSAIELATEYGVTGNPVGHSGYGLTLARQLLEIHKGNLVVISGTEAFCAGDHPPILQRLPAPWGGTIVVLEWRTNRPLDVTPVYRGWPDLEEELQ